METGVLKKWDDAKGFGFISVTGRSSDVFIHISSLKLMPRKPQVGDTILFQIERQANGKTKAYNCSIQGLSPLSSGKPHYHSQQRKIVRNKKTNILIKLIPVLTVVSAIFLYQTFVSQYSTSESSSLTPIQKVLHLIALQTFLLVAALAVKAKRIAAKWFPVKKPNFT